MNVTCPDCHTVFRVDPAKVPERGVRARCSVCGGLFPVHRADALAGTVTETAAQPPAPPAPPAPPPPRPRVAEVAPPPAPPVAVPPPPAEPVRPVGEMPAPAAPPVAPFFPVEPSAADATYQPTPPPAPSAPVETAVPIAGGTRFSNPFLQQDPSTRARRLARALVSDLVVYYPEKRERGLAEGNLKELFAEEIRKSWEEYSEQVGEELATATPYFTEALNEILAEGRPLFG
jgi:predicted Zn finger-like uncharacterized protein